jgi:(4S)-4-hydroxy-5-phosphonooxypentane-2,3-dione isomerase
LDEYLKHIQRDAKGARESEAGCELFHILLPEGVSDTVHLYEVYESEDAFNHHQKTPHFTSYVEATKAIVEERIIQRLTLC